MCPLSLSCRYLLNFLFDSTFGILIIYLLFKLINFVVNRWEITPLKSGEYGNISCVHTLPSSPPSLPPSLNR